MNEMLNDYFLGKLSKAEKEILLDRVLSDDAAKKEFMRMQNTVALSKLITQSGDEAYANRMMNEFNKKIQRKTYRRILRKTLKYAALATLLIINSWFLINLFNPADEPVTYTTIRVPKGQRVCTILHDGTEVWLSPRTVLRIPDKFNKSDRRIELDGEAYFVVTENAEKPFVVQTGTHNIVVLGTRFNVFAYSESHRFETDLLKGKVEVSNRFEPQISVILAPGEKVYLKDNQLIKTYSLFNNDEYLRNGIFTFSNKPFVEILEYLKLWYDVRFDIKDSAKKELLVSGKFRQSDEIKNILKALQGVHTFNYKEKEEQTIEIY